MDVPAKNLPFLPFEIMVMVLMLVPADDLVRFMLVCKEWHDLIKDADFIRQHFQVSASRGNNYLLCGSQNYLPIQPFNLLSDKSHAKILEKEIQFHSPTGQNCLPIYSSGGLLLLYDGSSKAASSTLYLYNPFIQKCKSITSTILNLGEGDIFRVHKVKGHIIGFGYHNQANDYKIARLVNIIYGGMDLKVHSIFQLEVYSLSTDSWKRIEVESSRKLYTNWFDNFTTQKTSALVMVHDCFHWLACLDIVDESRLLSFDLGKEAFQSVRLPNYELDGYDFEKLVSYKDKLSLMVLHPNGLKRYCSFWVLTEYGVFDSWSRLFTISIDARIERPLIFTRHDELIFKPKNLYVVHNIFTGKWQYIDVMDINPYRLLQFFPLTNSLTLIDSK